MNPNIKQNDDPHIIENYKKVTSEKNEALTNVIEQIDRKRVVNLPTPRHNIDFVTRVICDSITAD